MPSVGSQGTDLAKNGNFQADLLISLCFCTSCSGITKRWPGNPAREKAEATTNHLCLRHIKTSKENMGPNSEARTSIPETSVCLCRQSTILASQQRSHLDLTTVENYFESHNRFSQHSVRFKRLILYQRMEKGSTNWEHALSPVLHSDPIQWQPGVTWSSFHEPFGNCRYKIIFLTC